MQTHRRECGALDGQTAGRTDTRSPVAVSRARRVALIMSKSFPSFNALGSTSAADVICAGSEDAMDGLAHSYSSFHKISADFFI